ncbi:MAG: hypothetical protein AAFY53_09450 [Pseudomonadota bacterium]
MTTDKPAAETSRSHARARVWRTWQLLVHRSPLGVGAEREVSGTMNGGDGTAGGE